LKRFTTAKAANGGAEACTENVIIWTAAPVQVLIREGTKTWDGEGITCGEDLDPVRDQ
jgi:hypothetical protein